MSHEFVVVKNLTLNVLFGCDFMYKFEMIIDFVNRSVSFMGNLTVAKLLNQSCEWGKTARTVNSVILKPYTETVVRVSLQKGLQRCGSSCLGTHNTLRKPAVLDSASGGSSGRANYCL